MLSIPELKQRFNYDPETGALTYAQPCGKMKPGDEAGTLGGDGYLVFFIGRTKYRVHRVAWAIHHGRWPKKQIDHRDTIRTHNWIDNLREATQSQNQQNKKIYRNNSTGYKGVTLHRPSGRYQACVYANGKAHYLGYYDSPEAASDAATSKREELHRSFTRHR